MVRNERQFMGVRIVKWKMGRSSLATKVYWTSGHTCALRKDGSVLYNVDGFFKYYYADESVQHPILVEALWRLGAITKAQHDEFCERRHKNDEAKVRRYAASQLLNDAKAIGIKLTASQARAVAAAEGKSP